MPTDIKLNGKICDSDKNLLRKYLDIASVIFVVLDRNGNIISLNQELCRVLGLEVSEIRGKNWFDNFVAPKDIIWLRKEFKNLMSGNIDSSNINIENSIIDKNGNERIILWNNSLINSDNGTVYGIISSGMDITEKVRIQEEQTLIIVILKLLNRTDNKNDLIGEILSLVQKYSSFESVGIRLKDGNDYPYYHTIGFEDDFILEENSICRKCVSHSLNEIEQFEDCYECMCGAVISGKTREINLKYFTGQGTFWTNNPDEFIGKEKAWPDSIHNVRNKCYKEGYRSIALIPIKVSDENIGLLHLADKRKGMFKNGDIKFYENVVESIGIAIHRINIEDEMNKAQKKIKDSNDKLEEFAYKASHDLREPLRTITSYIEILEESLGREADRQQKEYIDKILDGSRVLDKFIDDLLSYSMIGTVTKKEIIDLNDICANVKKNLDYLFVEKNGTLIYDRLPIVIENKVLMMQLFQNLIGNSLKYDQEGRPPVIKISYKENDSQRIISISDNGIGIAEEHWDSVFQMFKRISPNKYRGSGMGLAICKKTIETLGGKIWFESEPNKGTTFYFTIMKHKD